MSSNLLINHYFSPFQKLSEVLAFPRQTSLSRYCAHKKSLLSLAAADRNNPNFMSTRIQHVHNPVLQLKRGFKRRLRQRAKKPFSGLKVGQMLEAREVEERRINAVRTSILSLAAKFQNLIQLKSNLIYFGDWD